MTQLSLLSGTNTPAKSCENEQQTDGFQICECGKGTLDCSIHPSTPEKWIASMRDSLAKTLALLAIKPDWEKELEAASTGKSCGLLASLSPDKSFWKTCQQSLVTDSEPFSQTWPRWGMTHGGFAYAHPMSERRITETGGGACVPDNQNFYHTPNTGGMDGGSNSRKALKTRMLPTPDAGCWRGAAKTETLQRKLDDGKRGHMGQIQNFIKLFPTPNASDCRDRGNMSMPSIQRRAKIGKQLGLSMVVHPTSGQLNPAWVAWLMGFPIEWVNLKDSEMLKSRSKPPLPGSSSEANK